jgi:hypothetical protein
MDKGAFDQADDPPANQSGEFICGRANRDGSPCQITVSVPYLSCHQNNQSDPIITN